MDNRTEPKWCPRETRPEPFFTNDQETKDGKDRHKEHEEVDGDKTGEQIVNGSTYHERGHHGQGTGQESGERLITSIVQVIAEQRIPIPPESGKRGGAERTPKRVSDSRPLSIGAAQAAALIFCVRRSSTHNQWYASSPPHIGHSSGPEALGTRIVPARRGVSPESKSDEGPLSAAARYYAARYVTPSPAPRGKPDCLLTFVAWRTCLRACDPVICKNAPSGSRSSLKNG